MARIPPLGKGFFDWAWRNSQEKIQSEQERKSVSKINLPLKDIAIAVFPNGVPEDQWPSVEVILKTEERFGGSKVLGRKLNLEAKVDNTPFLKIEDQEGDGELKIGEDDFRDDKRIAICSLQKGLTPGRLANCNFLRLQNDKENNRVYQTFQEAVVRQSGIIPAPKPAIQPLLSAGNIWSPLSPWELLNQEAWYKTYSLETPEDLEGLDSGLQIWIDDNVYAIERTWIEEWLSSLNEMLKDPSSCVAHVMPHLPNPTKKVRIFFHPNEFESELPAYFLPPMVGPWSGIHLNNWFRGSFLADFLGMQKSLSQSVKELILCHEMGHEILFRHYGLEHPPGGHDTQNNDEGFRKDRSNPTAAFIEGFSNYLGLYGVKKHTFWENILLHMEQLGADYFETLPTYRDLESNEAFVTVILFKLAMAAPGNYHRIMRVAKFDRKTLLGLSNFIKEYLQEYPSQKNLIRTLYLDYALRPKESVPKFLK